MKFLQISKRFQKLRGYKVPRLMTKVKILSTQNGEAREEAGLSKDTSDLAVQQFNEHGLSEHFAGIVGGYRSVDYVAGLIKRVTNYLTWTHNEIFKQSLDLKTDNIFDFLILVASKHYNLLSKYGHYLETIRGFTAGTILQHFYSIVEVVKWAAYFQQDHADQIDLKRFEYLLKAVTKAYNKKLNSTKTLKDMEVIVSHRRMPAGGLKSLMQCTFNDINVANEIMDNVHAINKDSFQTFMSILFSLMYVGAPQGRVGGLASLNYKHRDGLITKGYTLAKEFKTRAKYGYQPVLLPPECLPLFLGYVNQIYPIVMKMNNPMQETNRNDPLWINWNGEREMEIGREITKYFKRKMELHITTTSIRSLVGTQSNDLMESGLISAAEKASVDNVSGHDSLTMDMYYLLGDRIKDVHNSRKMFNIMKEKFGMVEVNQTVGGLEGVQQWPEVAQLEYIDWGTSHPDYNNNKKRAKWTVPELDYIQRWVNKFIGPEQSRRNVVAMLLKYITVGAGHREAKPIFHAIHVLDSTRLRHGYRIVVNDRPARENE
jgi:hypothetical protein